jgi:hypothetical protein
MASRRIVVVRIVGLVAVLLAVCAVGQAAGQAVGGVGAVNDKAGNGVTVTPAGAAKPAKMGLSLAGDKVFNDVKETYLISDNTQAARTPNGKPSIEQTNMQAMTKSVQGLINVNNNAMATKTFVADALANFKPAGKDFAAINKGTQILNTGTAKDENDNGDKGTETASAMAKQDAVTKPGTLSTKGTSATATTVAGKTIMNPMAVAYAVNLDPTAVTWTSQSARSVVLDLSNVTLTASTTGLGSLAAAALGVRGDYINGTDDVTTDQALASSLFTLSLGLLSADGKAPSITTDLTFLGYTSANDPGGLPVSDSLNDSGLTQVLADLASSFVPLGGGTYGFASGLSITFNVPGSSADTLLYFDEADGAGSAVPEPASLIALGQGLLCLAGLAWYRRVRPRSRLRAGCPYSSAAP